MRGVSKRFGSTVALDDVSLTVGSGQIVGFLGPNGSGKTTTMRSIMGLISVDAGTITWNGTTVDSTTRHRFGYMPAERGMYPKMNVREQLVYFARLAEQPLSTARDSADEWIERMDLTERSGDEIQSLSSGNQQRVQLAIALVHRPDLLILDEPFSGLDPIAVEVMKEMLVEQVDRGVAVLLSSHQLDLVTDVCRDVVIVDRGSILLDGDVRVLRERSPHRYAFARFGDVVHLDDAAALHPSDGSRANGWHVVTSQEREVALRVPAETDTQTVLAAFERLGQVVDFSFGPPELSEVFVHSVRDADRTQAANGADAASAMAGEPTP